MSHFWRAWVLCIVAGLLIVVSGCQHESGESGTSTAEPIDDLAAAQMRWDTSDVAAYSFVVASSCGERNGLGTYEITVEGASSTVENHDPHSGPPTVRSVPDLFDHIEIAVDLGADRVDVIYDQTLGYPTSIDIDYDQRAIDDEECYVVKAFRDTA